MINRKGSSSLNEGGQDLDHAAIQADIRKSVKIQPPDDSVEGIGELRHSNIDLDLKDLKSKEKKVHAHQEDAKECEEQEEPEEAKKEGCCAKVKRYAGHFTKFKKGIVLFQYEAADPDGVDDETGGGYQQSNN